MTRRVPIGALSRMIHVYPSLTMASQRAGQMWWQAYSERPLVRWALRLTRRLTGFAGRDDW